MMGKNYNDNGLLLAKERKIVENKCQDIPFPFEEIDTPVFQIELDWDLSDLTA